MKLTIDLTHFFVLSRHKISMILLWIQTQPTENWDSRTTTVQWCLWRRSCRTLLIWTDSACILRSCAPLVWPDDATGRWSGVGWSVLLWVTEKLDVKETIEAYCLDKTIIPGGCRAPMVVFLFVKIRRRNSSRHPPLTPSGEWLFTWTIPLGFCLSSESSLANWSTFTLFTPTLPSLFSPALGLGHVTLLWLWSRPDTGTTNIRSSDYTPLSLVSAAWKYLL